MTIRRIPASGKHRAGKQHGWAAWQQPWITLDYAVHPEVRTALEPEIVAWGIARFRALASARGRLLDYCIEAHEGDAARIALLERHGFARSTQHTIHLSRPPGTPLPDDTPPGGFTLRPVADAGDVAAYVALQRAAFGSDNMSVAWKERVRAAPGHMADWDLLAFAPSGAPAGFCVGWWRNPDAQIEPLGVHPDFARRGLGRALLAAMLRRMASCGATTAHIHVESDNPTARTLYTSLGFRPAHRIWKYVRRF